LVKIEEVVRANLVVLVAGAEDGAGGVSVVENPVSLCCSVLLSDETDTNVVVDILLVGVVVVVVASVVVVSGHFCAHLSQVFEYHPPSVSFSVPHHLPAIAGMHLECCLS